MAMTVRALATLALGQWLTEPGNRNEGALRAKGGPHGARLYFRYKDSQGHYDDLPIGTFDEKGRRGLTLEQSREHVRLLRNRYLSGDRDLRAAIERDECEKNRLRERDERLAQATKLKISATLDSLCSGYVAQLRDGKKPSARSVERALSIHVKDQWPALWNAPAEDVSTRDLLLVIARVANAGKLREAAKLRSYLRAAYGAAIRAQQDARGSEKLRELNIWNNPANNLVTIDGASKARKRALSLNELRSYWKQLSQLSNPSGSLLRFHLLTGAQRIEQLGRLTLADFDADSQTIRILDGKGRRKEPRIHDVPLIDPAVDELRRMGHEFGPFLFTVTGGLSGAVYFTVRHRLQAVIEAMKHACELEKGAFTVGDLRRTVETRLSAVGVSREQMAQLQSHGLGGVQSRHYNMYEYLPEKRASLEAFYRLLNDKPD